MATKDAYCHATCPTDEQNSARVIRRTTFDSETMRSSSVLCRSNSPTREAAIFVDADTRPCQMVVYQFFIVILASC